MPRVVREVLEKADDPSADVASVAALIERDPALAARILRISNSAYYGMRNQVGTLRLALVVLGLREVRNLIVGVAAFHAACGAHNAGPQVEALWRHSSLVGAFAKRLGERLGLFYQGEALAAGLLHDIGKAIMLRHFGEAYARMLEENGEGSETLSYVEEEAFGFDHAAAAAALALKWHLPATLVDAVYCHHNRPDRPFSAAKDPLLPALAWAADHGVDAAVNGMCMDAAAEGPAWDILDGAPKPAPPGERETTLAAIAAELGLATSMEVHPE